MVMQKDRPGVMAGPSLGIGGVPAEGPAKPGGDPTDQLAGLGFERVMEIDGNTFRDCSTIILVPMRGVEQHTKENDCVFGDHRRCRKPWVHDKVISSWMNLISPMNQKRAFIKIVGHEVGHAYTETIKNILQNDDLKKWKYILTLEDDNIPPPDAHIRLLESIEAGPFDAVSGIYFTKGDINMSMAYGDPDEYKRTGTLEFRPRDVRAALASGQIMEVNGIAMGCALWRLDLFRQIDQPWFVTVADIVPEKGGIACFTQDLYFCEKAKKAGKRFAVDMRVHTGHLDINSGIIY